MTTVNELKELIAQIPEDDGPAIHTGVVLVHKELQKNRTYTINYNERVSVQQQIKENLDNMSRHLGVKLVSASELKNNSVFSKGLTEEELKEIDVPTKTNIEAALQRFRERLRRRYF